MLKKIFIGGLSYSTTEKTLMEELQKFGEVISVRIVSDRDSGKSKGYGFASFKSEESADKAIASLDNTIFDGRRIGVKESIEKNRN